MSHAVKGVWNIVLSGYPRSGKTLLAKKLVADHPNMARINADEIRQMLFNETPPSRDEYLIFTLIAETRDNLLNKEYSTVIDSTAPDNTTREYLLTTPVKDVNQLLIVFTVDKQVLRQRSIETFGNDSLITAWDKRWQNPQRECCVFKFNSNNLQEFETSYVQLEELLESETHPYKPEFRTFRPTQEIRKTLRKLLRT